MPTYSITAPDGRVFPVTGDSPPNEQELEQIYSSLPSAQTAPANTAQLSFGKRPFTRQEAIDLGQQLSRRDELIARGIDPASMANDQGTLDPLTAEVAFNAPAAPLATPRAFVEGLGGGASLNLTDALAALTGNDLKSQAQPRVQSPAAFGAGQAIGTFLNPLASIPRLFGAAAPAVVAPTGQIIEAAKPLAALIKESISQAVPIGAVAAGAGQVAETGRETTAPELLGSTALGAVGGLALGTAAPIAIKGLAAVAKLPGAISTLAQRFIKSRAPVTAEESALGVLGSKNFTTADVERHIPIVTQRVDQAVGKIPQTAENALDSLNHTEQKLYSDRIANNLRGDQQGMRVSGDGGLAEARATLDDIPTMTQAERDAIMNKLAPIYQGDHTLTQGQAFQQRLNHEFEASYANDTFDRAAPEHEARLALRNYFADRMDKANQVLTGINETPYADIGSLIEVRAALQSKLDSLKLGSALKRTGMQGADPSLPATKFQAVTQIKRSALNPFQKSELEKLDENVRKIFEQGERQPPGIPMTPAQVAAQQAQFTPAPAPQPLTLAQQIQQAQAAHAQANSAAFAPSNLQVQHTRALEQPFFDARTQAISDAAQQEALNEIAAANTAKAAQRGEVAGVTQDVAAQFEQALAQNAAMKRLQAEQAAAQTQALSQEGQAQAAADLAASRAASAAKTSEVGAVKKDVQAAVLEALKSEAKTSASALRNTETGDILSDFYHFQNTNQLPQTVSRIEKELTRRLDLKKYSQDWPAIKDALGRPPSPNAPNVLPTKRELNLEELIKKASKK